MGPRLATIRTCLKSLDPAALIQPCPRTRNRPAARGWRIVAIGWLLGLATVLPAAAQSQRETERKLQQMRSELRDIGKERRKLEDQRGEASRRLRDADEKVARTARSLSQTETALREQQQALVQLQARREQMRQGLAQQRAELAGLLRAAYQIGDNAPLKLLLSQDTSADATRLLAYHRYVQQERARRIQALSAELAELDRLEQEIQDKRTALDQSRQQQQQQARELAQDRKQRAATIATLEDRYQERSEREKALGQDAKALETLLANLRAAAARAEAERRAAAKQAAADAAAQAKSGSRAGGKTPPKVVASAPAPKVGGLGWPVSGNLLARYGGRMPDGRSSSGVLIGAANGTPVTAVADGTVVFSDWMTGYGMILIIDHGNGYMSLYAHNDTLLRDAGASVKRGEAVARVGNSGGQGVPALYFELRRNGQPVDPSSWLQRR